MSPYFPPEEIPIHRAELEADRPSWRERLPEFDEVMEAREAESWAEYEVDR